MLDIGWQELMIVAILAIIVIGPKDLPRAVRNVMRAVRKVRGMASDFQSSLDEVAREADLDDLRREANKLTAIDPTEEIKKELDPAGEIEKAANFDQEIRETMIGAKQAAADTTRPAMADSDSAAAPVEAPVEETIYQTPGNSISEYADSEYAEETPREKRANEA